jgi:hypothetical protein
MCAKTVCAICRTFGVIRWLFKRLLGFRLIERQKSKSVHSNPPNLSFFHFILFFCFFFLVFVDQIAMSDSQKPSPKSTHIRLLIEKVRNSDASTRVPYVRELVDSMRGILSTSEEHVDAQFLFLEFVKEKTDEFCAMQLPASVVDAFLEILLEIANHNPSDEAPLSVIVIFQLILKCMLQSNAMKKDKSGEGEGRTNSHASPWAHQLLKNKSI